MSRAKQVAEVSAFIGVVVALVAWATGKPDLPGLIDSLKPHHQQSPTAAPPTKGALPAHAGIVVPDHAGKTNPLAVDLVLDPVTRISENRYSAEVRWTWDIKLNGALLSDLSGCTLKSTIVTPQEEVFGGGQAVSCDYNTIGDSWNIDVQGTPPGVYTISVFVTSKQGYHASASQRVSIVK